MALPVDELIRLAVYDRLAEMLGVEFNPNYPEEGLLLDYAVSYNTVTECRLIIRNCKLLVERQQERGDGGVVRYTTTKLAEAELSDPSSLHFTTIARMIGAAHAGQPAMINLVDWVLANGLQPR